MIHRKVMLSLWVFWNKEYSFVSSWQPFVFYVATVLFSSNVFIVESNFTCLEHIKQQHFNHVWFGLVTHI